MTEQSQEAANIADELIRLITRRLAEGAGSATVTAGLAHGLSLVRGLGPEGREIVETICNLLDKVPVPGAQEDHPR